MAIKKKVFEDGKVRYEVIVKVRDKAGKQIMRRKRWLNSKREADDLERQFLNELDGHNVPLFC